MAFYYFVILFIYLFCCFELYMLSKPASTQTYEYWTSLCNTWYH